MEHASLGRSARRTVAWAVAHLSHMCHGAAKNA